MKEDLKKDNINNCERNFRVTGHFWCDDNADVYVGNCETLSEKSLAQHNYKGPNSTKLEVAAKCCDYIYFACWSNDRGVNGFLAEVNGVKTNATDWKVFATGINFNSANPRPTRNSVIAQIQLANCNQYWTTPALGPKNSGNPTPITFTVPTISANANFIWFDSGLDASPSNPPVPFSGFNHKEYLIFRLPVKKIFPKECSKCKCKDCECCDNNCNGCNKNATIQEQILAKGAKGKFNTITGSNNATSLCSTKPYSQMSCSTALEIKSLNLCFYLHWGDSASDQIENTDCFETMFITVCNPYSDLQFRGIRINKILITPTAPLNNMQLVPDNLIYIDCLDPCSCKSKEFALNTRNATPGIYNIEVEYCTDEVCVIMNANGKTQFPINVIQD